MVFFKGTIPVLGHMLRFKKSIDSGFEAHPWAYVINEDMGKGLLPKVIGIFTGIELTLLISDPEMINEIYVSKNKYFDKHDQISRVFRPLLGHTMLF